MIKLKEISESEGNKVNMVSLTYKVEVLYFLPLNFNSNTKTGITHIENDTTWNLLCM